MWILYIFLCLLGLFVPRVKMFWFNSFEFCRAESWIDRWFREPVFHIALYLNFSFVLLLGINFTFKKKKSFTCDNLPCKLPLSLSQEQFYGSRCCPLWFLRFGHPLQCDTMSGPSCLVLHEERMYNSWHGVFLAGDSWWNSTDIFAYYIGKLRQMS